MTTETMTLYKLMILYFLNQVDYPLTNAQMSGFLLEQEYTNYFTIQQVISDLIEAELIRAEVIRNSSYFRITEEGRTTLHFFEDRISDDIKADIRRFLSENSYTLRQEVSAPADYYEQKKGEYIAHCRLLEHGSTLLELSICVPSEEKAAQVCDEWHNKSEEIYQLLFDRMVLGKS